MFQYEDLQHVRQGAVLSLSGEAQQLLGRGRHAKVDGVGFAFSRACHVGAMPLRCTECNNKRTSRTPAGTALFTSRESKGAGRLRVDVPEVAPL